MNDCHLPTLTTATMSHIIHTIKQQYTYVFAKESMHLLPRFLINELRSCPVADKGGMTCGLDPGSVTRHDKDGYLSSLVARETGLGGPECPWVIQVPAGQRINITLLDFALPTSYSRPSDVCSVYATVREDVRGSRLEMNVCGGERRIKTVHLSETNRIEVVMSSLVTGHRDPDGFLPYFLLHYKGLLFN
jgi:hypothetical protein